MWQLPATAWDFGRAIDRALLHRVAEATIKDFLDQTGQAIQHLADQQRRTTGSA
jgi:hypothetical protein